MESVNLSAAPQHLERLAGWHHRQWGCLHPGAGIERVRAELQRHLGEAVIPSTFVARDGDVLGSAAIVERDMRTRPDDGPWLASVYVAPEARGRGVGTRLVRHVMQVARDTNVPELFLFTPDRAGFYARLGWRVVSHETYQGSEVTVMHIALDG